MSETILITGANRGIGLELTRSYAEAGWQVLACCRQPREATELTALAAGAAGRIELHPLDVGDAASIAALADSLKEAAIDILLHNAGISGPKPQSFDSVDEAGWLEAFRVNAIAPLKLSAALVEQVARSRRRVIALMGTQLGSIGDNTSGGQYAYRSSKAAEHMVAKSMAVDLKPRHITVVTLHPGWVRTALGGPAAPLSPQQCAASLFAVLEGLHWDDSGKFIAYDGREIPW